MLFILAPSKTMDFTAADVKGEPTVPRFEAEARQIVEAVRGLKDIGTTMKVSPALALATSQLYSQWGKQTKPAIYTYVGDVYKGFHANTLTKEDVAWAQHHIRIMSGLYGMVRPLDLVSGYRLEMKAKVKVNGAKDLYDFWSDRLAQSADSEVDDGTICVLSSDEYARPITRYTKSRVVTPIFLDNKPNGQVGTVPIYSKMMRGVMARWVIDHRVREPEELQKFEAQGYYYDRAHSTKNSPAFYRMAPSPIVYR